MTAVSLGIDHWEQRSVTEPEAEQVIKGPREGFTEAIRVNVSLIRRRMRSPKCKIQYLSLGRYTHTDVALLYTEGIADKTIIKK